MTVEQKKILHSHNHRQQLQDDLNKFTDCCLWWVGVGVGVLVIVLGVMIFKGV